MYLWPQGTRTRIKPKGKQAKLGMVTHSYR